jgi:hypothetical protein
MEILTSEAGMRMRSGGGRGGRGSREGKGRRIID